MTRPSPLQNRVTPFGAIVALPDRGLFTGNRGIIHDPASHTLLKRRWATKSWLICLCAFKGWWRPVMGRRSWTELFFLDEATALAAGHRPCFTCRRADAERFRTAWVAGNGGERPRAAAIDAVLHAERLANRVKRLHPLNRPTADLPDGAMIAAGNESYVLAGGTSFRWSPAGYAAVAQVPERPLLLTPPSTVRALAAGYRPILHPSVLGRPSGRGATKY